MIFLLYTGTSALIIYISNIQRAQKYSAVMNWKYAQDGALAKRVQDAVGGPNFLLTLSALFCQNCAPQLRKIQEIESEREIGHRR